MTNADSADRTLDATVKLNVIPVRDLWRLLPADVQQDEELWNIFARCYAVEISAMFETARSAQGEAYIGLYPWRRGGSQWIAEFEVRDTAKPLRNEHNWHGMNTSQWLYAGCILYDERDRRISLHH